LDLLPILPRMRGLAHNTCVEEKHATGSEEHVGPPAYPVRHPAQDEGAQHHPRHEPAHRGLALPVLLTHCQATSIREKLTARLLSKLDEISFQY
jgi:hypothetical protein